MKQIQLHSSYRSFLYSPVVLVILIICLILLGRATLDARGKYLYSLSKRDEAEGALRGVEERKAVLIDDLNKLKTERGKEAVLRDKFDIVKLGEEVMVILESEPKTEKVSGTVLSD